MSIWVGCEIRRVCIARPTQDNMRISMKKYNLIKVALLTVVAGFCISGQFVRPENQELAMTRCTNIEARPSCRPEKEDDKEEKDEEFGCHKNVLRGDQNQMKGAARKVVEGDGKTSFEFETQGAAKRARASGHFRGGDASALRRRVRFGLP